MMILDTFCKQGGASVGLHRTFPKARIVGVDIEPQPRYPFEFYEADALYFLEQYGKQFDLIWASPPCHGYSFASAGNGVEYPDLVLPTRILLQETGRPYIIENVPGAPLIYNVLLCGTMFDLRVFRHRIFETSFAVEQPVHPTHTSGMRRGNDRDSYKTVAGHWGGVKYWSLAMGIDWMDEAGLTQAVPPAYSEYLARYAPR